LYCFDAVSFFDVVGPRRRGRRRSGGRLHRAVVVGVVSAQDGFGRPATHAISGEFPDEINRRIREFVQRHNGDSRTRRKHRRLTAKGIRLTAPTGAGLDAVCEERFADFA
jgi:hypothetical protein